jgi:hypothetical protein
MQSAVQMTRTIEGSARTLDEARCRRQVMNVPMRAAFRIETVGLIRPIR